jgi:AraC family transcriptional regulator, transcriptional activator of pobA
VGKDKIYNLDLIYKDVPMPFVIRTLMDIEEQSGGIVDDPHKHNYYSIVWSIAANGKHIIDFKEYPIVANQIFFVNPDQVHQVIAEPKPIGYVILFTPEFLQMNSIRKDFIDDLKLFQKSDETPPLMLSEKMTETLKTFAGQMMNAFQQAGEMHLEIIGAYLKLFLIECNTHCSLTPNSNTQSVEVGKSMVKHFKDVVEQQFMQWHQVQHYAEALHVTPNYLNEVNSSRSQTYVVVYTKKRKRNRF